MIISDKSREDAIREAAMAKIDKWWAEFRAEFEAEVALNPEVASRADASLVIPTWMTAARSVYDHITSIVRSTGGEIVETKVSDKVESA